MDQLSPTETKPRERVGGPKAGSRLRFLPPDATADARVLLAARGVRAFGDGFISVLLPLYLTALGLTGLHIGGITTATLVGSGALTLAVGLLAYRFKRRPAAGGDRARLHLRACVLAAARRRLRRDAEPVVRGGERVPAAGTVALAADQTVPAAQRTALFARYSLVGSLLGAVGALFAGLPAFLAAHSALGFDRALQAMFSGSTRSSA